VKSERAKVKADSFLWQLSIGDDHLCFPLPIRKDAVPSTDGGQPPSHESRLEAELPRDDELLGGLSAAEAVALGRILPSLACGEESAVHAFYREGDRTSEKSLAASRVLLYQIAKEEERHERLLRRLRGHCPVPDDLELIRRRAQWFFLQIASKDPAIHFSRIAGLDSGVCILMSAAVHKTRVFSRAPAILRIFNLIRDEEARHVKFSRKHALELGIQPTELAECTENARTGLVNILSPIADAFETFGVDPDRLFLRILHEVVT